jgi:hypothetical protein
MSSCFVALRASPPVRQQTSNSIFFIMIDQFAVCRNSLRPYALEIPSPNSKKIVAAASNCFSDSKIDQICCRNRKQQIASNNALGPPAKCLSSPARTESTLASWQATSQERSVNSRLSVALKSVRSHRHSPFPAGTDVFCGKHGRRKRHGCRHRCVISWR